MKPVTVSVEVPNDREEVYAYLAVLANHESFTDHMMVDWVLSGPRSGVGARANVQVAAPASRERIEIEVIEAEPPRRIVEEDVSARGKRRTRGTYLLEELADGGTMISFRLEWLLAPRHEQVAAPLLRAFMRRSNGKALRRLARQLKGDDRRRA